MSTVLSQHYLHGQWRTSCCNCLYKVWAHKSSFTFYWSVCTKPLSRHERGLSCISVLRVLTLPLYMIFFYRILELFLQCSMFFSFLICFTHFRNMICEWTLTSTPLTEVNVSIVFVNLDNDGSICYHSLTIGGEYPFVSKRYKKTDHEWTIQWHRQDLAQTQIEKKINKKHNTEN